MRVNKYLIMLAFLGIIAISFSGKLNAATLRDSGSIEPYFQKAKNGVQASSATLSGNGEIVTGFQVAAAGTAQVCGLFDSSLATMNITNGILEVTVPANTSQYFDFSQAPLRTTSGLALYCSRTDGYTVTYTLQPGP